MSCPFERNVTIFEFMQIGLMSNKLAGSSSEEKKQDPVMDLWTGIGGTFAAAGAGSINREVF